MRIASIDIGTNTIRLLISEITDSNRLMQLYLERVITRLGEGFSEDSRLITQPASDRSISALKKFSDIINNHNVDKIKAVATSVVRESINGNEFIEKAEEQTGIVIDVISGKQEAELTVLGTLNSVNPSGSKSIIFDIGGGSTEYVLIDDSEILEAESLNIGVVHLTERFLIEETEAELAYLSDFIQQSLINGLGPFQNLEENIHLIATAGTPTTLAAMDMELEIYNPELVNGYVLKRNNISLMLERIRGIDKTDRAKLKGLEKGREDIIVTGIIILLETMRFFSAEEVIVSDGGVLEGIAYSMIS